MCMNGPLMIQLCQGCNIHLSTYPTADGALGRTWVRDVPGPPCGPGRLGARAAAPVDRPFAQGGPDIKSASGIDSRRSTRRPKRRVAADPAAAGRLGAQGARKGGPAQIAPGPLSDQGSAVTLQGWDRAHRLWWRLLGILTGDRSKPGVPAVFVRPASDPVVMDATAPSLSGRWM